MFDWAVAKHSQIRFNARDRQQCNSNPILQGCFKRRTCLDLVVSSVQWQKAGAHFELQSCYHPLHLPALEMVQAL